MLDSRELPFISRDEVARALAEAALKAGPVIMDVYRAEGARAWAKDDGSPVTEADERAEAAIVCDLRAKLPNVAIVGEEGGGTRKLSPNGAFVLVDPLDGTKEFLARNGEFTVNVALVSNGRPIAGAVYAPALERIWIGGETAFASEAPCGSGFPKLERWRRIHARPAPASIVAVASRSHADPETDAFLKGLPVGARRIVGSSLKFCLLAQGEADVYPRFGATMEWDTAAGHAVLVAAGGVVLTPQGAPFLYGKSDCGLRNGAFIAWGDPAAAAHSFRR